jgi:hypothetical protein
MKNDARAPRTYTSTEIAGWIRRYRGSGFGLRTFAHQHGLSPSRLHYWVYQKHGAELRPPRSAPAVFQELKLTPGLALSNWAVEISLPAGPVVRFSASATPAWMSAVIEALRRPC